MAKPGGRSTSSALGGRPSVVKMSDLTIWPTLTPMARAASSAVRVPSGNSRTSISRPAARAASTTRWEEGGRAARPGLIEGRVAEGSWFGGLPMSGLLLGLHAVDGAEFRQAYLFRDVLEDDLNRHIAADGVRVGVNADEVRVES